MSSTSKKTWAEIASKPMSTPAKPKRDIPCPRCMHKNPLVILDDFPEDYPRPGCTECTFCFPQKIGQMAGIRPNMAGGTPVIPPRRRTARATPNGDQITSKSSNSPQTSGIQFGTFTSEPEKSQTSNLELDTILLTPPQSPKSKVKDPNPNSLFFSLDEEEEASYAEFLKGSTSDDTPANKRGAGPAIGFERGKESKFPNKWQSESIRYASVFGPRRRSIFHNFERDLARGREAYKRLPQASELGKTEKHYELDVD